MRIQKYISEQGICSRREAEAYMLQGLVWVNGTVVKELSTQIDPTKDKVELDPKLAKLQQAKTTIVINKPRGYVSSPFKNEGKPIFELLPPKYKQLNIVGRLDKESEGLLLLSNDGSITALVTGDDHRMEKEYEVHVRERVTTTKLKNMAAGIELPEDGLTLPARTRRMTDTAFRITLREGRNHQIRRMCEAMHLTVGSLKRLRIGSLLLENLPSGGYRVLSPEEIITLKATAK